MKKKVHAHAIISGRVQGVCFRMETSRTAQMHGVWGWVRNLPDGTVEAVFEGDEDEVAAVLEWCKHGPPASDVKSVDVTWDEYSGEYQRFDITY